MDIVTIIIIIIITSFLSFETLQYLWLDDELHPKGAYDQGHVAVFLHFDPDPLTNFGTGEAKHFK